MSKFTKFDWVGRWFTPVKYKHYIIPENSANYVDLRGKKGQCMGYSQSSFGHVWAVMMIDGKLHNVRTCYLVPANNDPDKLEEVCEPSMSVVDRAKYSLTEAGNHGTIAYYEKRDDV